MKRLLPILMITFFILILSACGESDIKKVDDNDNATENSNADSGNNAGDETNDAEEKSDKVYGIGDTVSIDGMEVTINNASWSKASEYVPAENGKVLRLEVSFHNVSSESGLVDNTSFTAYDGEGNAVDAYYGSDDPNVNMFTHDLKKGKKAQGTIEFDVPESDFYEIYYEPAFTLKENAEIMWKIESSKIK